VGFHSVAALLAGVVLSATNRWTNVKVNHVTMKELVNRVLVGLDVCAQKVFQVPTAE
jgi:hypothetical protein